MSNHEDERGIIEDLKVGKDWSVTYISFKKGAVRGNHYHEETYQKDIVLSGKVLFKTDMSMTLSEKVCVKGDVIEIPPKYPHVYKALEDTDMVSICIGKRIGENYEEDTFRLETPLL